MLQIMLQEPPKGDFQTLLSIYPNFHTATGDPKKKIRIYLEKATDRGQNFPSIRIFPSCCKTNTPLFYLGKHCKLRRSRKQLTSFFSSKTNNWHFRKQIADIFVFKQTADFLISNWHDPYILSKKAYFPNFYMLLDTLLHSQAFFVKKLGKESNKENPLPLAGLKRGWPIYTTEAHLVLISRKEP